MQKRLREHLKRVNYQLGILKRAQETSLPTYNKQVKASICRNKSSEICQKSSICARALWNWGDFCNVLIGLTFSIPVTILFDTGTGNKKRLIDIAN
jgi:hypothetical protein